MPTTDEIIGAIILGMVMAPICYYLFGIGRD